MKVGELIAALEDFDANDEVHFSYNYGDYGRTMVAPSVESVDQLSVIHSSYHNTYRLADEDEEERGKDTRCVVVLKA